MGTATDSRIWPFYDASTARKVNDMVAAGDVYNSREHPEIRSLETNFLATSGLAGHSLFVGSGTAALLAGFFGLALPPGSEVLVPVYTFHATVTPLLLLDVTPVFYDVDPRSGLVDLDDARRRITPRTRALVLTHLWGQVADSSAARRLCDDHGMGLVEDCSHAHGASRNGLPAGHLADVAAFSLGTKKLVSGGLGGILVTRSASVYERAVVLTQPRPRAESILERTSSRLLPYASTGLGLNLRGSPISAVLAHDHLDRLPGTIATKNRNLRAVTKVITESLGDQLRVPAIPRDVDGTLYMLALDAHRAEERARLIARLNIAGLRASAAPAGLQYEAIVTEGARLRLGRGGRIASAGDFPAARRLESHGIRLDTLDMYDQWPDSRLARATTSLAVPDRRPLRRGR